MDEHRFDDVTRLLAAPNSRRGVLRRLAALALGAGLGGQVTAAAAGWDPYDCTDLVSCSANPGYFHDRFQSCINNPDTGRYGTGRCAFCMTWSACTGPLETGTGCGTQNHQCGEPQHSKTWFP